MRVFDSARQVSAADVARQAGIRLQRRGSREWACCPFHKEKTASCMFDSAGRYHCFGCNADGDGIDLYAFLHGIDKLMAARELANDRRIPRSAHHVVVWKPHFLDEADDQGYTWETLCAIKWAAQDGMDGETPDSQQFWDMLAYRSEADVRMDNLLAGEENR